MANSSDDLITNPFERAWAAWSRFWFTPADPTPLCLMRIVAGLLVLYVHIAYTFDLQPLMGGDGWYNAQQADRERREWAGLGQGPKWPSLDGVVPPAGRPDRVPPFPPQP